MTNTYIDSSGVYDNGQRCWSNNNRPTASLFSINSLKSNENDTVVEYYRSSSSWYRLYSSGWLEMGGYQGRRSNENSVVVYFPNSFKTYPLSVSITIEGSGRYNQCGIIKSVTKSSMEIQVKYSSEENASEGFYWYVCGY